MRFPQGIVASAKALPALAFALTILGTGVGAPTAAAEPPLHHVKYTVFTETPFPNASIYYRDVDPPSWADYSHNPYLYSPKVEAPVGPNQMWTLDVMLADPNAWAMVTATSFEAALEPNFHCVLAVDGEVVSTNQGPKGALCSIRNW
jgi:hypothetical protein